MNEREEINRQWMAMAKNMNNAWLAIMECWSNNQQNMANEFTKQTEHMEATRPSAFFPYKSAVQSLFKFVRIGIENQFAFSDLMKDSFSMETFKKMYPHLSEDWYKELTKNMQSNLSPLLKVFHGDHLTKYNRLLTEKQIELMRLVYKTGISAMENYSE